MPPPQAGHWSRKLHPCRKQETRVAKVQPRPLMVDEYVTVRFDKKRDYYAEGSVMIVMQGRLG